MSITRALVEAELKKWIDPYLQTDLLSARAIKDISIHNNQINLQITLGYPARNHEKYLIEPLKKIFSALNTDIKIDVTTKIETHVGNKNVKAHPQIKNVIAIASGKGGVGKSTTAVNLALALSCEGARVGLLDADIYGPSQPQMLGVSAEERPDVKDKKIIPMMRHGIQSVSIGYLVDTSAAMVWRGPMVSMALQQLMNDTQWDNLDYLIIDLPPGTGDIQLTLSQKIPVSGAVIVTTPQDLALLDVRRACEMFRKVNVPVLGIIENMSTHLCSNCGHEEKIFGEGGGARIAHEYQVNLLGSLPLNIQIREQTDAGNPPVVQNPDSPFAKIYCEIARKVAAILSLQLKDYSGKFPAIVVK